METENLTEVVKMKGVFKEVAVSNEGKACHI